MARPAHPAGWIGMRPRFENIDTSILILLGGLRETDPLPGELVITVATRAELSVGRRVAASCPTMAKPSVRLESLVPHPDRR